MSELPSGWNKRTLSSIVNISNGGTPSTKKLSYWGDDISWITPKDLSNFTSRFIYKGEKSISNLGLDNSSAKLLPKNTILFSSRAPIGYVVIAGKELSTNQGFKNLICDEENSHFLYMYYWLKQNASYIEKLSSGSTFAETSTSLMKSLSINLPINIEEQKAIANILSSFDNKIELLKEQNKTLEDMAQTIFKEWFIKFNYPNTDGEVIESKMGKIPKGWRVGVLEEEFDILMGQSPKGDSYNTIGEGEVFYQGRAEFQERFPKRRLFTKEPKRMAKKFDVLISVRAPVGDINIACEKCCIGRGLASISSDYKSYTYYKMKSLKRVFDSFESEGSVFGSINKNSLRGLSVVIPSQRIIKEFEETIQPLDKKIYNNSMQVISLSKMRDNILPKLISGEKRVEGFRK